MKIHPGIPWYRRVFGRDGISQARTVGVDILRSTAPVEIVSFR